MTRRKLLVLIGAVIAAGLSRRAEAHGGGLDSLGCHHNRKKGGYHCHRGPLAGQFFDTKEDAIRALQKLQ